MARVGISGRGGSMTHTLTLASHLRGSLIQLSHCSHTWGTYGITSIRVHPTGRIATPLPANPMTEGCGIAHGMRSRRHAGYSLPSQHVSAGTVRSVRSQYIRQTAKRRRHSQRAHSDDTLVTRYFFSTSWLVCHVCHTRSHEITRDHSTSWLVSKFGSFAKYK